MRALRPLVLLATLLLPAPGAGAQEARPDPRLRPALAGLERALDRAVSEVAPPSPMALLGGPGGSHGYHLDGLGAFFVLPPRRLPSRHPLFFLHTPSGRVMLEGPEGEELAERMAALHAEAERMNAEAERAYRRVRREIRIRLREETGAREAADVPGGRGAGEGADEPHPHAPPPPWHFWFDSDARGSVPRDRTSDDELVTAVRGALTAALESEAARLPVLRPEEFVAVAVDFVSDPFFQEGAGRARTLVVRARYGDLEARRRGELSAEELRERIVSQEY